MQRTVETATQAAEMVVQRRGAAMFAKKMQRCVAAMAMAIVSLTRVEVGMGIGVLEGRSVAAVVTTSKVVHRGNSR